MVKPRARRFRRLSEKCYTNIANRIDLMLALRLPPEIEARLDDLAKRTGRSKSFYARAAILEYLDDIEDVFLAERRVEDLRRGESDTVPLSDLMTRYGVAD